MFRRIAYLALLVAATLGADGRRAAAQRSILDELVLLQAKSEQSKGAERVLGRPPGLLTEGYGKIPGTPSVGGAPGEPADPIDASQASYLQGGPGSMEIQVDPPSLHVPTIELPEFGPVELPGGYDPGPPGGLTLDMAIGRLLEANLELRARALAIPEAEANQLAASLLSNPYLFFSAAEIPYGEYTEEKPGENTYALVFLYPLDVTHKRKAKMLVASRAKSVIQAQYQDVVRQEIGNLYHAFVNVLAAREAVRYARASIPQLEEDRRAIQQRGGDTSAIDAQLGIAHIEVRRAEEKLHAAKVDLATLLNWPLHEAGQIEVYGRLYDPGPPPPPIEDLVYIAQQCRPDLVAHRLGTDLADAELKLAEANRLGDLYLLYEPYHYANHAWTDKQSSTSWAVGIFAPIPILNRNQGHIRKARVNITETRTRAVALERQVAAEVIKAAREYATSRETLLQVQQQILPSVQQRHAEERQKYQSGQSSREAHQASSSDYTSTIRFYRDAAIQHRHNTLHLNTVVGQRIMP